VDVRVIASTNRDLTAEVAAGRFRGDLYYRLAVVELVVPPLREHREDIPALVLEFARRYREQFAAGDVRLSLELVEALGAADWPGNVRQLENGVARLIAMSSTGDIGLEALPLVIAPPASVEGSHAPHAAEHPAPAPEPPGGLPPLDASVTGAMPLRLYLEAVERGVLARTLSITTGNQSEAARRLGISRSSLFDRMKKYHLP
jgi:two-component system response regulator AtoC